VACLAVAAPLRLLGLPQGARRLAAQRPQGLLDAAKQVEVILLIGDRGLAVAEPLGVNQRQPLLHPLAAVATDLLDGRQGAKLRGPRRAVAAVGAAAAQPA
jgi:hypothetical protein